MSNGRLDGESFDDYRSRRRVENAAVVQRGRGIPFFVSRSGPFKGEDGKMYFRTGSYRDGMLVNAKEYRVDK